MSAIINQDDIACASAAADLFCARNPTNEDMALVAQLFADHREKAEEKRSVSRWPTAQRYVDEMHGALKELVAAQKASCDAFGAEEIDRIEAAIKKASEFL